MHISERAKELAHKMWNDDSSAEQDLETFQQALNAERNDALAEAVVACNHAWTKAGNRLPNHADCIAEIKAIKEKSK